MKILLIILCILIASPVMGGLEFDGANNYITVSNNASLNPTIISISAWVKTDDLTKTQMIVAKRDGTDRSYYLFINKKDPHFDFRIRLNTDPLTDYIIAGANDSVVVDTWYHVAVTFEDGGDRKLYINGEDTGIITTDNSAAIPTVNSDVYIGSHSAGSEIWDGIIYDARIYNIALTSAEIQTIYNSRGSDNIVNGLVGRWLMNEKPDGSTATVASSVIDISGNGNDGSPSDTPITYRATPIKLIRRPR